MRLTRDTLFLPIAAAALYAASGSIAQAAPIYEYDATLPVQGLSTNDGGGKIVAINTVYDSNTETFTWSYEAEPGTGGNINDGFWLVVSDGDNPKGHVDEYAILYGDLDANRVTAYVYNGQNSPNSVNDPQAFLQSFAGAFSNTDHGAGAISFTIDTSYLNSAAAAGIAGNTNAAPNDWEGVTFDQQLGIWFHATSGTNITYDDTTNGKGKILTYSKQGAGWADGADFTTTKVPEPGVLSLAGLGLVAIRRVAPSGTTTNGRHRVLIRPVEAFGSGWHSAASARLDPFGYPGA